MSDVKKFHTSTAWRSDRKPNGEGISFVRELILWMAPCTGRASRVIYDHEDIDVR